MWCYECKEYIGNKDNSVKKNGKTYHLFCYLQKIGITLPLDFSNDLFIPEEDLQSEDDE